MKELTQAEAEQLHNGGFHSCKIEVRKDQMLYIPGGWLVAHYSTDKTAGVIYIKKQICFPRCAKL